MDPLQETIDTYDRHAASWAEKFDGFESRKEDVKIAISLLSPREHIRALELGCAHGREAADIIPLVDEYVGIDASKEFIAMAKRRLPHARFDVARMEDYEFPPNLDLVVAFASLLHLTKESVRKIFAKSHAAMTDGGIFLMSAQQGEGEQVRDEPRGRRFFSLFTPEEIDDLAGSGFERVYTNPYMLREKAWFETALRKRS